MAESQRPDWVLPAILVAAAVVVALLAGGIFYAVAGDDEPATFTEELEAYTECLADHGANVPVIETRSDGGLVITVPGALLEGDFDLERFARARESCRHLEPNPLELLFAGEGLGIAPLLEGGPGPGNGIPGLIELCERLALGDLDDRRAADELAKICHELGG